MANYKHGELWKSLQNEEFDEGDVWDVLRDDINISSEEQPKTTVVSSYTKPYLASKSIKIGHTTSSSRQVVQRSAPVKIPTNWSKLVKESKTEPGVEIDDNGYKLPPHEMVARRLAKSHISTFSVTEGVGRTLKGRDLSTVREAVLRKTGFIEPN